MNADNNFQILILFFLLVFIFHVGVLLLCLAIPIIFLQILLPWTPNITAIFMTLFIIKEKDGVSKLVAGWKKWRVHPKWYLLALSPMFVYLISAGIYIAMGGIPPGPTSNPLLGLGFPAIVILTIFTGATGEELGWRGFALPRLQKRFNALISSVLLGLYWGIWHIPMWILFNASFTIESTLFFVSNTILHSIVITCICNNTRGSVLLASIFHWSVNLWSYFVTSEMGFITHEMANWIKTPIYLAIALFLVLYYGPERLSKDPKKGSPDLNDEFESIE